MNYHDRYMGISVIKLGSRLTVQEVEDLMHEFIEVMHLNPDKIGINFEKIDSIDSSGISVLVKISKIALTEGVELIFYAMNEPLERLFSVGGLDSFFEIYTKEEFDLAFS